MLKTERDLPPLLLGPKFPCKHFPYKPNEYFHLHGGIEVDVGTPPLEHISEEMKVRMSPTWIPIFPYAVCNNLNAR